MFQLTNFVIIILLINILVADRVENVKIIGNNITKDEIILREIQHNLPGEFDSLMAQEDRNRIYNLGSFSTVEIKAVNQVFNVYVVETFRFLPLPIVNYDEAKGWSYGASVVYLNFQGLNQKLILGVILGEEKTWFLNFEDPWIAGDHISFHGGFYQYYSENAVYSYGYRENGSYCGSGAYINENNRITGSLGIELITTDTLAVNDDLKHLPPNLSFNYRYLRFKLLYTFDSRDIFIDPEKGALFKVLFTPKYGIKGTRSYYRLYLENSKYVPIKKIPLNSVFSSKTSLFLQYSQSLPPFAYEYVGGEDYVRGYSPLPRENPNVEDLIEGFNIFYQNFQLQHTLFEKKDYGGVELGIDLVYFADMGIASEKPESFRIKNVIFGYGFGLRLFASGAGVIGIDFGFNPYGGRFLHLSDSAD